MPYGLQHRQAGNAAGRKRSAKEAEAAEEEEEVDDAAMDVAAAGLEVAENAAVGPELTAVDSAPRRSRRAAAAAAVHAAAAAVLANDEAAEPAVRSLPQRSAAVRSPAGKRRRLTGMLQLAAAAEAAIAVDLGLQTAEQEAAFAALDEAETALAMAEGVETASDSEPTGAGINYPVGLLLALNSIHSQCPLQTNPAADGLPEHLKETRAALTKAHVANRRRIESTRRAKGVARSFVVGDDVLLLPSRSGSCGSTVAPRKLVCRVVGTSEAPNGTKQYQLRCNAGLLKGRFSVSELEAAVPSVAQQLRFTGTQVTHVPKVSVATARGDVICSCKKACGSNPKCPCQQRGAKCSRNCRCAACKGHNCGNY